jgi:hypothetical protein
MKIINKLIVAMLFVGGTQLVSMERSNVGGTQLVFMERSNVARTVAKGLSRAGRVTGRGFEAIMYSGIDFAELNRKIEQKHKNDGNAYESLK